MQHAVIGTHVNGGFPTPIGVQKILIGAVAVNDMVIVHGRRNRDRGGVNDVPQLPDLAVGGARPHTGLVCAADVGDEIVHPLIVCSTQIVPDTRSTRIHDTQIGFDGRCIAGIKADHLTI